MVELLRYLSLSGIFIPVALTYTGVLALLEARVDEVGIYRVAAEGLGTLGGLEGISNPLVAAETGRRIRSWIMETPFQPPLQEAIRRAWAEGDQEQVEVVHGQEHQPGGHGGRDADDHGGRHHDHHHPPLGVAVDACDPVANQR